MIARPSEISTVDRSSPMDLTDVVASLRQLRDSSLAARQRLACPVKLPSKRVLTNMVEGLSAALFPNRLGSRVLTNECVDYFVGHTLDIALGELVEQLERELHFWTSESEDPLTESAQAFRRRQATGIVREFASRLPDMRELLETDIVAAYDGDPAANSVDEVLACHAGVTAVVHHRIAHQLHDLGAALTARIVAQLAHAATGIDIHPAAQIGPGFFIDNGNGVVIGETAIIGSRVRLHQGVTLGAKGVASDGRRRVAKSEPRHPIVEDEVVIYSGATVLGRVTIGRGSVIGGNVWITASVPPGSTITQAKVQSEDFHGGAGI